MSDKKIRIAISGTIGSGKSEVCQYLRKKGYDVFDCDEENRRLLSEGNSGYKKVIKAFPEVYIDGKLDKKKLSQIVFEDEKKRKKLEAIMHPLILKKLQSRNDEILFAEVPLLFEVNWDRYFDLNVLVIANEDKVIKRLIKRGLDEKEINDRIAAQMSVEEKIKRADKIIYNNGSLKKLHQLIDELLKEIL